MRDGNPQEATTERRTRFEYDELLACGRGELFGPGNAQLPCAYADVRPYLGDFRDRRKRRQGCTSGTARGQARSLVLLLPLQGRSVMPGCLGLDALWQMRAFPRLARRPGPRAALSSAR